MYLLEKCWPYRKDLQFWGCLLHPKHQQVYYLHFLNTNQENLFKKNQSNIVADYIFYSQNHLEFYTIYNASLVSCFFRWNVKSSIVCNFSQCIRCLWDPSTVKNSSQFGHTVCISGRILTLKNVTSLIIKDVTFFRVNYYTDVSNQTDGDIDVVVRNE